MLNANDLHDYQKKIVKEIVTKTATALFVDMGLGKTISTLTAIEYLLRKEKVKKVLIIAPLRVALNTWTQESEKWQHTKDLKFTQLAGLSLKKRRESVLDNSPIHIINRENVRWITDFLGKKWQYDMVVIDESSSFKSAKSERFKALKRVLHKIKRKVLLTGTPASNGLVDLYSQIYLLDGGERLGRTFTAFRNRFYDYNPFSFKLTLKHGRDKEIQDLIKDVCLTLNAKDYLELPPLIFNNVYVELNKVCKKYYKTLEDEFILTLENTEVKANNSAILTNKLLQFSNGAVYTESGEFTIFHDEKIEALKSIIEENSGKPLLVAYTFKSDLLRLKKAFPYGIDIRDDLQAIAKWNRGEIPLLFAHPSSAGHGLNLQKGGSTIVWFGLNWSLELYQQFNARLYRQGQTDKVFIHHIVAKKTVDETILKALQDKETNQNNLLNALKHDILKKG